MSTISDIGDESLRGLPAAMVRIENKIKDWKTDIRLDGKNLQSAVVEQPSLLAYYDQITVEANTIVKYIAMLEKKVRGERLKYIKEHAAHDYTDTALQRLIDGDKEYIKMHQVLLEVEELYDKCKSIVESFKQRSYCLNNIVKIRESELENITIRLE